MHNARDCGQESTRQSDGALLLSQAGLRRTRERMRVLEVLIHFHVPCSIEMIQGEVKDAVNRVTLYRMLEQFAEKGIVERVVLRDGVRRYEYQDQHHHHITCTACGTRARVEVSEQALSRAVCKQAKDFPVITSHTLEFYGVCRECV